MLDSSVVIFNSFAYFFSPTKNVVINNSRREYCALCLNHLMIFFIYIFCDRQEELWPNNRVVWVGRDLRRSLVQSPALSRVSCEIRQGSSELYPVRSWKLPLMKDWTTSLGDLFQWLSSCWKCFSFYQLESLVSAYLCCFLSFAMHLYNEFGFIFSKATLQVLKAVF